MKAKIPAILVSVEKDRRFEADLKLRKHNFGDNMEKCLRKSVFSIIMPKRCSNPEIRAE